MKTAGLCHKPLSLARWLGCEVTWEVKAQSVWANCLALRAARACSRAGGLGTQDVFSFSPARYFQEQRHTGCVGIVGDFLLEVQLRSELFTLSSSFQSSWSSSEPMCLFLGLTTGSPRKVLCPAAAGTLYCQAVVHRFASRSPSSWRVSSTRGTRSSSPDVNGFPADSPLHGEKGGTGYS